MASEKREEKREEYGGRGSCLKKLFLLNRWDFNRHLQLVCPKQDAYGMNSNRASNPKVLSPPCSFSSQLKSHPSEGIDNAQITLFGFVRFARRGECCQAPQDKLCWMLALVPVWTQKKKNQEPWKEAGAAHGSFPLLTNDGCCAR